MSIKNPLSKTLLGLTLLALPLAALAWQQCDSQRHISRGAWQALIHAQGVDGGCSIMEIDIAMGPRSQPAAKLTLRNSDPVIDMELTDLDQDRVPELLLITRNVGSGSYGGATLVITGQQELVPLALPDVDPGAHPGYRGHDRILFRPGMLIRTFPVYQDQDPNCCPSGGRQTLIYQFNGTGFELQ